MKMKLKLAIIKSQFLSLNCSLMIRKVGDTMYVVRLVLTQWFRNYNAEKYIALCISEIGWNLWFGNSWTIVMIQVKRKLRILVLRPTFSIYKEVGKRYYFCCIENCQPTLQNVKSNAFLYRPIYEEKAYFLWNCTSRSIRNWIEFSTGRIGKT